MKAKQVRATIKDRFWSAQLLVNAQTAIVHQWDHLEKSGCINNFRIVAGDLQGNHEGWFFADSDAYKWLDAAARIYSHHPSPALRSQMNAFMEIIRSVQTPDGYIYTYNQINFPLSRWENLLIEHELYCHGHLIEACIAYFQSTGDVGALQIAARSADLLVREFLKASDISTSGHEEIEIALLRLFELTRKQAYVDLASAFLERRGKAFFFPLHLISQSVRAGFRRKIADKKKRIFQKLHLDTPPIEPSPTNAGKRQRFSRIRWLLSALSGKYFQMHKPIRDQREPAGHSVRMGYLQTALARMIQSKFDADILRALEQTWHKMVERHMFITGGIGAVPGLEGFGREYALDPEYAYAETCAAVACLFWNWEMQQLTKKAFYSDLFEWQLYNATAVGMGIRGDRYLYNNPLSSHGGIGREPWFSVPCCPSNISRVWADLGGYICSSNDDHVWIHQLVGSYISISSGIDVKIVSELPWDGNVSITVILEAPREFTLSVRIPSWSSETRTQINGIPYLPSPDLIKNTGYEFAASGYDPRASYYLPIHRLWKPNDTVSLEYDMSIQPRKASLKVMGHEGKVAITRGPLIFCLESLDNPQVDIFIDKIMINTLKYSFSPALFTGTGVIQGESSGGFACIFIPYYLWANRGESSMTVWVNNGEI